MALPCQTYYAKDKPLFYPVGQTIVVPSIEASTITGAEILIQDGDAGWGVVSALPNQIAEVMTVPFDTGVISHIDIKTDANNSTINQYIQGYLTAGTSNYTMQYTIVDPGVSSNVAGSISFLSSIGPGTGGGVDIQSQDGTAVIVGGESVYSGVPSKGNFLLQSFVGDDQALIAHYSSNAVYQSQILFSGGSGGASTITLQSGSGNVAVEVGQIGITMTPGASNAVTLMNGSFDVNNVPITNVSTINQALFPPVTYIDPYGASPIFSTIGSSAVAVPMIPFSTIAGKTYQVSVEYSAVNGGGGNATDATSIGITNSNSGTGLYGRFIGVDTWITDQTYDGYRANVTAIFPCNSNNSGQSVLELLDVTTGGNVQIVTLEQLTVKDLGFPVNVF
jgi:hypothetical protein